MRSTRRLVGGIQAKEEVRYDSPGDGFNEGIFAYFPSFLVAFKQKQPSNH